MIGVFTNANENLSENIAAVVGSANINEAAAGVAGLNPLGTQGFSLGFSQIGC